MLLRGSSRLVVVAVMLGLVACVAPVGERVGEPSLTRLTLGAGPVGARLLEPAWAQDEPAAEDDDEDSLLVGALLYLPNRIFDVLDIVRARVRLGPGFAVGVRATEFADVFVGSYLSVWAGLHGPRGWTGIPWPAGLESRTGVELSVADATIDGPIGPDYGTAEFGLGGQLGLIGVDLGVDPFEILDFVLGLFTVDLGEDDF